MLEQLTPRTPLASYKKWLTYLRTIDYHVLIVDKQENSSLPRFIFQQNPGV